MPKSTIQPVSVDAIQLKDGSGYYVRVEWPHGQVDQVSDNSNTNDFRSESEANDWIANKLAEWVEQHPLSK